MLDSPPLSTPPSSLSFSPLSLSPTCARPSVRSRGAKGAGGGSVNSSFLCSIVPGAPGLVRGWECAVMGKGRRELSVCLLLRCVPASFLDFSSGCLLYLLKYLSPPITESFWGSTGFTGLPFWQMPFPWQQDILVLCHLLLLHLLVDCWGFHMHCGFSEDSVSVFHHCYVVYLEGKKASQNQTSRPSSSSSTQWRFLPF